MASRQLLWVPSQQLGAVYKLCSKMFSPLTVEYLMLYTFLRIADYFAQISGSKELFFQLFLFIYLFLVFIFK